MINLPPRQLTADDFKQLSQGIARIFEQTQNSRVGNDIKNHVALHGIHKIYASHKLEIKNEGAKLTGERRFLTAIEDMIQRFILMKKGVASADRVVKFVAGYIRYIHEKASTDAALEEEEDDNGTSESRFTKKLANYLLGGFIAKDKNVRYRVLQLMTEMTPHLGEIDEEQYNALRAGLIGRTMDRESNVRVQAFTSLINLSGPFSSEDISELDGEPSIMDVLLEGLAHDPSAEVRRTILGKLQPNNESLPAILGRLRDTDANVRRNVYKALMHQQACENDELSKTSCNMGQTHPRTLTVLQRETIIQSGLGDRDATVRFAAEKLISSWINAIHAETKHEEIDVKTNANSDEAWVSTLVNFLTLFDLIEASNIAVDALLSAFASKDPKIHDKIEFSNQYWLKLTPEKAFLVRVFVEHCRSIKQDATLDEILPEVSKIAFQIQTAYNMLSEHDNINMADIVDDAERERLEDENISQTVVLSELLKLAVHLNYSDETGRRRTFQLVRGMLSTEVLPQKLVALCLDVLRTLTPSERDLIRIIVEIVGELRDAVYNDEFGIEQVNVDTESNTTTLPAKSTLTRKLREEMTAEQRMQIDQVDLRCLNLCIEMLGRVNSTFEQNSTLVAVLDNLILPALRRDDSTILRQKGWKSLGLCCLIARHIALQSFGLFIQRIPLSSGAIKTTLVQSLFDIVMVHKNVIFQTNDHNVTLEQFTANVLNLILTEEEPKIQALLCMGTAKLLISGTLTTVEIFVQVFLDVCEDRRIVEDVEEDTEIVSSAQLADMFVEWTDPRQLSKAIEERESNESNTLVQLDMAENVILLLFGKDLKVDIQKEDKRVLCQLLNKLHVPDIVDDYKIRSMKILMDNLKTRRPLRDNVCLNAFNKFEATIAKKFEKQLEGFTELEFRKLEELTELFEFLDRIIPLDDDEDDEIERRTRGKKRRSNSFTSANESRPHSPVPMSKPRTKRPRLSRSSDEDSISETEQPLDAVTRTLPRRAAAPTRFHPVIVISSDSEEEPPAPRAARSSRSQPSPTVKEELNQGDQALISGASSLTLSEVAYDSIMDTEEEEEEEVNDLLANSE